MASINTETLVKIRDRLITCLDMMHDEANASAKEEVIHAIAKLDDIIKSNVQTERAKLVYPLILRIIEKLPWIISTMRDLD